MRKIMKERRLKLGLSQEQVAKSANITRANYAHFERGRRAPKLEYMIAIAKVLRVKPDLNFFKDFCDETDQESNSSA